MRKNDKFRTIILTTGGTIEKTYDETDGKLENRETIIETNILNRLRLPYSQVEVQHILSKDSLYMDDSDRQLVLDSILANQQYAHGLLVIHGTDTMEVTAKYCFERLKAPSIPVVFTGAMKPMGFIDSDAYQNVIEALYALRISTPGFYISFHGKLFDVPMVRKNREKRTFEEF